MHVGRSLDQALCWSRPSCWSLSCLVFSGAGVVLAPTSPVPPCLSAPTECRELLLQTAVPILQELIEKGEEEDACIELLSNILEVLYKAQKVNPVFSAASFSLSSSHLGSDLTKPV